MSDTRRRKVQIETEDSTTEDVEAGEQQEQQQESDELQLLRKSLEEEKKRADEAQDRYLRTLAEFQNFKRRQDERESSMRRFAARELILKVLDIVDDFERALSHADETHSFETLHNGLELTLRKLMDMLEAEGVTPIEAVGEQFDPMRHEAVMRVEDGEHPDNTVVNELQKGYCIDSEVIRPSRVAVAVSQE